ncbi:MAG: nuclear transport factor 2 family protein [Saprospiraceae bacterium]
MQLAEKNQQLIQVFFTAFANKDLDTMLDCYHKNVIYDDVGFGKQEGEKAKKVWRFLIQNVDKNAIITFSNIQISASTGQANWTTKYTFGKRKITNQITATFRFQDGKIIYHKDDYSLWKWSQQAFGLIGFLIGWLPLFRWLIRWQMQRNLQRFVKNELDSSQM